MLIVWFFAFAFWTNFVIPFLIFHSYSLEQMNIFLFSTQQIHPHQNLILLLIRPIPGQQILYLPIFDLFQPLRHSLIMVILFQLIVNLFQTDHFLNFFLQLRKLIQRRWQFLWKMLLGDTEQFRWLIQHWKIHVIFWHPERLQLIRYLIDCLILQRFLVRVNPF